MGSITSATPANRSTLLEDSLRRDEDQNTAPELYIASARLLLWTVWPVAQKFNCHNENAVSADRYGFGNTKQMQINTTNKAFTKRNLQKWRCRVTAGFKVKVQYVYVVPWRSLHHCWRSEPRKLSDFLLVLRNKHSNTCEKKVTAISLWLSLGSCACKIGLLVYKWRHTRVIKRFLVAARLHTYWTSQLGIGSEQMQTTGGLWQNSSDKSYFKISEKLRSGYTMACNS